jgi:hypothetical protein
MSIHAATGAGHEFMKCAVLHVISTPPSRRPLQQREGTCPKEAVVALEAATTDAPTAAPFRNENAGTSPTIQVRCPT